MYMSIYLSHLYMYHLTGVHKCWKKTMDPLKLELQIIVNNDAGAGTKSRSSARLISALNQ